MRLFRGGHTAKKPCGIGLEGHSRVENALSKGLKRSFL
jgi:hypothetical protein